MNKTHTIGLPVSPACHLYHHIEEIDEIKLTFGGGMGGSSITEYGTIHSRTTDTILFTNFLGQKMELNKRYVVWIKPKKMLTATFDISGWARIRVDSIKNQLPKDKKMNRTIYKVIDVDDEVEFTGDYDNTSMVHTVDEII